MSSKQELSMQNKNTLDEKKMNERKYDNAKKMNMNMNMNMKKKKRHDNKDFKRLSMDTLNVNVSCNNSDQNKESFSLSRYQYISVFYLLYTFYCILPFGWSSEEAAALPTTPSQNQTWPWSLILSNALAIFVLVTGRGRKSAIQSSTHKGEADFTFTSLNANKCKTVNDFESRYLDKSSSSTIVNSKSSSEGPIGFIYDFKGDMDASQACSLGDFVSFIIKVARHGKDRVIIRLESAGGEVSSYGLASSHIARLHKEAIDTVVCVDKCAASGGYMMCAPASYILAAPFAFIGSIGVASEIPNFHRLLKKQDIDYHQLTCGKYKRTMSTFGEVTDEGISQTQSDMDKIHNHFGNWVGLYRSKRFPKKVKLDHLTTGQVWIAKDALSIGLIDEIGTSEEYIDKLMKTHLVVLVEPSTSSYGLGSFFCKLFSKVMNDSTGAKVLSQLSSFLRVTFNRQNAFQFV